jgi:hypothetical protein
VEKNIEYNIEVPAAVVGVESFDTVPLILEGSD